MDAPTSTTKQQLDAVHDTFAPVWGSLLGRIGHASAHQGTLKLGARMEEIMEALKLCVVQGVQACDLGVPILAEEIAKLLATAKWT